MTKRFALGLSVALLLGAGGVVWATGTQAQNAPLCTLPGKATYSPGALVRHEQQVYRCMFVFGEELKPAGVAWIKMEPTFAPVEPASMMR
jgi:hypothetical protein